MVAKNLPPTYVHCPFYIPCITFLYSTPLTCFTVTSVTSYFQDTPKKSLNFQYAQRKMINLSHRDLRQKIKRNDPIMRTLYALYLFVCVYVCVCIYIFLLE